MASAPVASLLVHPQPLQTLISTTLAMADRPLPRAAMNLVYMHLCHNAPWDSRVSGQCPGSVAAEFTLGELLLAVRAWQSSLTAFQFAQGLLAHTCVSLGLLGKARSHSFLFVALAQPLPKTWCHFGRL